MFSRQVNGLVKQGDELFLRGKKVATSPMKEAVQAFLSVLRCVGGNEKVVLVAHNAFSFDANFVLKLVASVGMLAELSAVVLGFSDTLPLFREQLPQRVERRQPFSLEALAKDFLEEEFNLHEAVEDVSVLEKLIERVKLAPEHIVEAVKPLHKFRAFKANGGQDPASRVQSLEVD